MSRVDADGALAFQLDSAGSGRDTGLVDIRNTARRAQVATQAIAVRQLVEELLANDNDERETPHPAKHTHVRAHTHVRLNVCVLGNRARSFSLAAAPEGSACAVL